MAKLIVGMDPGVRTGLAAVEISSGKVFLRTMRNASRSDIVDAIMQFGEPVLLATDMCRPPRAVARVASAFGVLMWRPGRNFGKMEKLRLTRAFAGATPHERDALAAALAARRHLSPLLRKIEKKLRQAKLQDFSDEVKAGVIKKRMPISRAVAMLKAG